MKRSVCKSLCLLLTFALLVCALPAASLAAIRTEAEDNNSYQKANPLDLGDTVRGAISEINDNDFFTLRPTESGYLTLRVSHAYLEDADADWDLTVYRFTTKLEQIYDTRVEGVNPDTVLPRIGVQPGSYYVEITRGYSFDAVKNVEYRLTCDFTRTDCWESEPNGNYTAANPFTLGQTYGGFIGEINDRDFFRLTIAEKGYLNIKVEHEYLEDASADWDLTVYRFTTKLEQIYDTRIEGTVPETALPKIGVEPGAYYIEITRGYSFDAVRDVEYHLSVSQTKTDWWEAEPNDSYTAANPFTPGQTYGGFIGDMTDKDFFKVTVTEKGYLNIKVEHEYLEDAAAEWTVEVYRFTTDLKSLTSEDIPGTSVSTSLPRLGVEPGTYYVSVTRGYSFDAVQDVEYHLTVGFSKNALLLGDLDLDGSITASDARLALRGAVGLEHFNADFTAIGDVDFDGKITAADARKILRAAVGLEILE